MVQYLDYAGLQRFWTLIQTEQASAIDDKTETLATKTEVNTLNTAVQANATALQAIQNANYVETNELGNIRGLDVSTFLSAATTPSTIGSANPTGTYQYLDDTGTIAVLDTLKGVQATDATNAADINTLNNTTIPGINQAITALQNSTASIQSIPVATVQSLVAGN